MSVSRRIHRLAMAALVTLGVSLSAGAAPAAALETRTLTGSFGLFKVVSGMSIDQANGNLYFAEGELESAGSQEVRVFGPGGEVPVGGGPSGITGTGTPQESFAFAPADLVNIAVDNTCYLKKLSNPECTAFDPSNEDIYVADAYYHKVVDKFRLNGANEYEYVCQFTGHGNSGVSCVSSGEAGEGFEQPRGVAVDAVGDVYIGDSSNAGSTVYEYNPAGEEIAAYSAVSIGRNSLSELAVTPSGTIYLLENDGLYEIRRSSLTGEAEEPEGEPVVVIPHGVQSIAIDQATRHLFVVLGNADIGSAFVEELDSANNIVGSFGLGIMVFHGSLGGIAVNEVTGDVYVGSDATVGVSTARVLRFGPYVVLPDVSTGGVSGAQRTSAILKGSVNPLGKAASCHFEYGTEPPYNQVAPCPELGEGEGEEPIGVTLTGLQPNSTYHYRLVGENKNGANNGQYQAFATPAVNGVQTAPASLVEVSSATLNGSLHPDGLDAHYWFEYGLSETYGSRSPEPPGTDAGEATEETHAEASVEGLAPGTTYHYRLVAENESGVSYGQDRTLTTPPAVEGVTTGAATAIQATSVTLTGSLEPLGVDTYYFFEYGTSEAYGARNPEPPGGHAGSVPVAQASTAVSGLEPNQTYHYRLVGENEFGQTPGDDRTFTTPAVAPVIDQAPAASEVARTVARLTGALIDPEHSHTRYHVEYGPSEEYAYRTAGLDAGSGFGDQAVTVVLSELRPNTIYHYRLVASNQAGTVETGDLTFTTAAGTPPLVVTGAASAVTQTTGTIAGTVNTVGLQTSYAFRVGTSPGSLGPLIGLNAAGAGLSEATASLGLTGLQPATTYYYRLVASNLDGTSEGAVMSFTTPGFSGALIVPGALPLIATPTVAWPAGTEVNTSTPKAKTKGKAKKKGKGGRKKHARVKLRAKKHRGKR